MVASRSAGACSHGPGTFTAVGRCVGIYDGCGGRSWHAEQRVGRETYDALLAAAGVTDYDRRGASRAASACVTPVLARRTEVHGKGRAQVARAKGSTPCLRLV